MSRDETPLHSTDDRSALYGLAEIIYAKTNKVRNMYLIEIIFSLTLSQKSEVLNSFQQPLSKFQLKPVVF